MAAPLKISVVVVAVVIHAMVITSISCASSGTRTGPETFKTEEYLANWGLDAIQASKAYEAGWTGADTLIGVIDSGYDIDHSDLVSQIVSIDDPSLPPWDHGTHVAGIVAASKNDVGMHGVAYDSRLALRHLGESIQGMADSFTYFAEIRPTVVNNSWGVDVSINTILNDPDYRSGVKDVYETLSSIESWFGGPPEEWRNYIDSLRQAQEHSVIVFSASNRRSLDDIDIYSGMPLLFPELTAWLAVVNVNENMVLRSVKCGSAAEFCLAAPGTDIYSTVVGDGYWTFSGASMAAPHVSGAVAIAAQMYPAAESYELSRLVLATATDIGEPGIDETFGWGFLNVGNLARTSSPCGRVLFAGASAARAKTLNVMASMVASHLKEGRSRRAFSPSPHLEGPFNVLPVLPELAMSGMELPVNLNQASRSEGGLAFWSRTAYSSGPVISAAGIPESRTRIRGGMVGVDLLTRSRFILGLGVGISRTEVATDGHDRGEAEGLQGYLYTSFNQGHWYTDLTGGIARFDQQHRRSVIPGLDDTVLGAQGLRGYARTSETAHFLSGRTGYSFSAFPWRIAPYLEGSVNRQLMSGAEEGGIPLLNYRLERSKSLNYRYGGGLEVEREIPLEHFSITAGADLGYSRNEGDRTSPVEVSLLGTSMTAHTGDPGRDAFNAGASLGFASKSGRFLFAAGYRGEFRKVESHQVEAALSFRF